MGCESFKTWLVERSMFLFCSQRAPEAASNVGASAPTPPLVEPRFLTFEADVEFWVVMTPDELTRAERRDRALFRSPEV